MVQPWKRLPAWVGRHRRTTLIAGAAIVLVLVLVAFRLGEGGVQYFTATVERGDIVAVVNATGTIDAVTTVEVGSQVTGMISALYADFNSRVTKGALIAQIDPAPFRARVLQAEADLASAQAGVKSLQADLLVAAANREKARAALREAELNRGRTLELFQQKVASEQQRDSVEIAHQTAAANLQAAEAQMAQIEARVEQQRAQVKQREAQLENAQLDLDHTFIRAPIDGTVIARNVDVGQTVAASLQAPTLFTIAQDLTKMLVYAKTDEADVGRIRAGGRASFKVDSFPEDTFYGRIKEVRMNASIVQNVVTYDTVVEFENPTLKLLPGMTAYVTMPVASARQVVKIPNGALRYQPAVPEEERRALLAQYGLGSGQAPRGENKPGTVQAKEAEDGTSDEQAEEPRPRRSEEERARRRERFAQMSPEERARMRQQFQQRRQQQEKRFQGHARRDSEGTYHIVWKLNPDGTLKPLRVKTGLTDFAFTALLEGELQEGDQLVIGEVRQRSGRSPFSGRMFRRF